MTTAAMDSALGGEGRLDALVMLSEGRPDRRYPFDCNTVRRRLLEPV